jgi:hypothetical protein
MESAEFKEESTKRPYVSFEGVGPALDNLWRKIVWRSNNSSCFSHGIFHNFGDPKVTNLHKVLTGEEDVL